MFSRIRAYVSGSPLTHVVIAAFIGAVLPIVEPMIFNGKGFDVPTLKVALYAGLAAVIRAAILLVPSKATPPAPPAPPAA